jgi:hypothetical protein
LENKSFINRVKLILNSSFLFIFWAGILVNLDKLVMGKYTIAKDHDFWDTTWPLQAAIVERVKQGKLPLWLAGYQSGSEFCFWDVNWLSLPVLLNFISSGPLGYFLTMLTQFLIAAGGMYLFLKKFYPERPLSEATLAGVLYALAIIDLTFWRVPDLAALPLLLYSFYEFVDYFSGRKDAWWNAILSYAIVALNVYLLKGIPALACFLLFFIFFYKRQQTVKKLIIFFFFISFIFVLNAPTLINSLVHIGHGMRQRLVHPVAAESSLALYLSRFLELIKSPHAIISMSAGTIATYIFFVSFLNYKKWTHLTKSIFLYFCVSSFLFYSMNDTAWFDELRGKFPFSSYHLNHLLIVFTFILFLVFFENIIFFANYLKKHAARAWLIICTVTVILMSWHPRHGFPTSLYEMTITAFGLLALIAIFYFIKNREVSNEKIILLFSFVIFTERLLHLYATKIALVNPPSFEHFANSPSYSMLNDEPKKYDYRITYINWHPSVGLYNNFHVAGGMSNDYMMGYAEYWNLVLNEDPNYFAYPYKAYLDDPTTLFESATPNFHKNLNFNFDLLAFNNVKYVFTIHEIESPEKYGLKLFHRGISPMRTEGLERLKQAFERIAEAPDYFIYLVDNYAPRFFINKSAQYFPDEKSLILHMKTADRKSLPHKTLLSQENIPSSMKNDLLIFTNDKAQTMESVNPTSYDDDKIDFSIDVKEPTFLIINDNHSPYWFARVNGEEVPVLKAYLTFKAIPLLKSGAAKVELYYAPKAVIWAYYFSAAAFVILVISVLLTGTNLLIKKNKKKFN